MCRTPGRVALSTCDHPTLDQKRCFTTKLSKVQEVLQEFQINHNVSSSGSSSQVSSGLVKPFTLNPTPGVYSPSATHHHCPPSLLGPCELRIDLRDFENNYYFAKYASFRVLGESEKYKLVLGDFLGGNAGKLAAAQWERLFSRACQKCSAFIVQSYIMQTSCTIYILGQFFKTGHGTAGGK